MDYTKQPSFLKIIFGAVVLAFRGNLKVSPTLKFIKDYELVKPIARTDSDGNISIGIYKKQTSLYFIKRWQGHAKDLSYWYLANESIFSNLLGKYNLDSNIKTPRIVEMFEDNDSCTVIFEFIEGKNLSELDIDRQAEVINKIIERLNFVSRSLTLEERKSLPKRRLAFYLLLLFVSSFLITVIKPSRFKVIFKSLASALSSLKFVINKPLSLAHRDLTPENILIAGDGSIYLLDLEMMVLTLSNYDLAYISVLPDQQDLTKALNIDLKHIVFLRNYILLHQILGSGKFLSFREDFFSFLQQVHE